MNRQLSSRVARRLIQRYPAAWRERYEDEVLALVAESPAGLADVAELARGLLVERLRSLVESTDTPSRTLTILGLLKPVFALLFTLIAIGTGQLLHRWQPASANFSAVAEWLLPLLILGVGAAQLVFLVRGSRWAGPAFTPPAWIGLTALPLTLVAIVLFEWAVADTTTPRDTYWITRFNSLYWFVMLAAYLSSNLWPGRRLLQALQEWTAAEERLKGAQKWVDGCHEMIALGVPSPLADAQAQVDEWTRVRDNARRRVDELGYRARFARV